LKNELRSIKNSNHALDLVVLSHVDNDHIMGLCQMMLDLQQEQNDSRLQIGGLWHNSFSDTIVDCTDIQPMLKGFITNLVEHGQTMPNARTMAFGIREGDRLTSLANELHIGINELFARGLILGAIATAPIQIDNLGVRILGPTRQNLVKLCKSWQKWLEKTRSRTFAATEVDKSIPNLSSIVILAEADEKKILLTGDGVGDDLLENVRQMGLLADNGRLHVDIMKVPHHGSTRNVSREFFDTITADRYVISANGRYGNPDLESLERLVESANHQKRPIEIILTNHTSVIEKLCKKYGPDEYGYSISVMPTGASSQVLALSS
jgi:ribonuclease BN (tRNA processing enzyme)